MSIQENSLLILLTRNGGSVYDHTQQRSKERKAPISSSAAGYGVKENGDEEDVYKNSFSFSNTTTSCRYDDIVETFKQQSHCVTPSTSQSTSSVMNNTAVVACCSTPPSSTTNYQDSLNNLTDNPSTQSLVHSDDLRNYDVLSGRS